VIVDLSVDFSTSLNDTFITISVMPKILQNLMALNNSVAIDSVMYSAAVDMIFDREVPRMNGSLISADNVTACAYLCMSVAALCRSAVFLVRTDTGHFSCLKITRLKYPRNLPSVIYRIRQPLLLLFGV